MTKIDFSYSQKPTKRLNKKIENNRNREKCNYIGNFISMFQLTCSHLQEMTAR